MIVFLLLPVRNIDVDNVRVLSYVRKRAVAECPRDLP